jgi:hypothetical protein
VAGFEIEEIVNGALFAEHPVNLHAMVIHLLLGETIGLDIRTSTDRLPAFNPANPLNWNHTNAAERLAWDSAAGTATYTANKAGQDRLAVTFEVGDRFTTGYVTIDVR